MAAGTELAFDPAGGDPLEHIAGREPAPAFAPAVADQVRRLFGLLADDSLRQIASLRVEGDTNDQIASALDMSLRAIERKLELIRKAWEREQES